MAPQDPDNGRPKGPGTDLAARVATIGYWYHKFDLPGGITTSGGEGFGHIVRSTGFDKVDGAKPVENPDAPPYCRGIVTGRRMAVAERLGEESA